MQKIVDKDIIFLFCFLFLLKILYRRKQMKGNKKLQVYAWRFRLARAGSPAGFGKCKASCIMPVGRPTKKRAIWPVFCTGASGGTWTPTRLPSQDFKSCASADSATLANPYNIDSIRIFCIFVKCFFKTIFGCFCTFFGQFLLNFLELFIG